jgi:hypothetical protein
MGVYVHGSARKIGVALGGGIQSWNLVESVYLTIGALCNMVP